MVGAVQLAAIWLGAAIGIGVLATWMARDRSPGWFYQYRDYPRIDERLLVAIGVIVDASFATFALRADASGTFWAAFVVVLGAQSLLIGARLVVVSRRKETRIWRHVHRP